MLGCFGPACLSVRVLVNKGQKTDFLKWSNYPGLCQKEVPCEAHSSPTDGEKPKKFRKVLPQTLEF
jgi:hypothetical protein